MAVENLKGAFVTSQIDAVPPSYPSSIHNRGSIRSVIDRVQFSATASVNSTAVMARVPSDAVPLPHLSSVFFDDFGTNATVIDIGDANDPDGLADGIDVNSGAGKADPFKEVGNNEIGDPFWKLLNYAEDPGGELEIIATVLGGAATAAADFAWVLAYKHHD